LLVGKFPKYPDIWETSKILKISIGFWEIWRIPQIPGILGNSPNTWESGEFPKCLGIW